MVFLTVLYWHVHVGVALSIACDVFFVISRLLQKIQNSEAGWAHPAGKVSVCVCTIFVMNLSSKKVSSETFRVEVFGLSHPPCALGCFTYLCRRFWEELGSNVQRAAELRVWWDKGSGYGGTHYLIHVESWISTTASCGWSNITFWVYIHRFMLVVWAHQKRIIFIGSQRADHRSG